MPTLYLIRHGETEWNRIGRLQGQADVPLSDRGRRQAEALRPRLAALGIAGLYASDLSRARETAEVILPDLPPQFDTRLREIDVGDLAGTSRGDWGQVDPDWLESWRRDRQNTAFPGGESSAAMQQRTLACLAEIISRHPGEKIAVVTHGGPMKAVVCAALGLSILERDHFRIDNTGITAIHWEGEEHTLLFLNDIAHLAYLEAPRRVDL